MAHSPLIINSTYIIAAVLFILGLKLLNSVRSARKGNFVAAIGMMIAAGVTLLTNGIDNYWVIAGAIAVGTVIGVLAAQLIQMTAMPQMVAIFNGFGGLASVLVAASELMKHNYEVPAFTLATIVIGTLIGAVTFSGSIIAFGKLQGIVYQQAVVFPLQNILNAILTLALIVLGVYLFCPTANPLLFWVLIGGALLLGVLFVIRIGGADMPVVISFLNSCSGVAAAMAGFVLLNKVLIVAGSLVGAAGLILTMIMCKAMNRTLKNVFFSGFGAQAATASKAGAKDYSNVKSCSAEEAAMIFDGIQQVIIVPGYGLAVARAQHAIGEFQKLLEKKGVEVKYAIHPVAGRMPGHMNVLLAEADVPYEKLYEMDVINSEFEQADVVLVVGANDVTNPVARSDKGSPIYGMPILNVDKARSVIVIKRSLSPGYAGIKNPLFENDSTLMLFDDAKKAIEGLIKEMS